MPVRHVQSQQISYLRYPILSQLPALGCPGMFHQHARSTCLRFGSCWLAKDWGALLQLHQFYGRLYLIVVLDIAMGVQQRVGTVSLNFFLWAIIFKS